MEKQKNVTNQQEQRVNQPQSTTGGSRKDFHYYLSLKPSNQTVPLLDCRQALIDGYMARLHRNRIFSPFYFLDLKEQLNLIEHELNENSELLKNTDDMVLFDNCLRLVQLHTTLYDYVPKTSEKDYFIYGYCLSMYADKKYDDCLFLRGHERENCILSDLLSEEAKYENARRAQARIVSNASGKDKKKSKN